MLGDEVDMLGDDDVLGKGSDAEKKSDENT